LRKTWRPRRTETSLANARRARAAPAPQQGRGGDDEQQQRDRRDRRDHELVLVALEEADGREHHAAEHAQRDDVEDRLGDERAEHDRQALADAAEPARDDERA
jgi:hypothetical protein